MKTIITALALALSMTAFANHHEEKDMKGHDKEHQHVDATAKDHDHSEEHHKKHDHKAHHPDHTDAKTPKKK